MYIPKMDIQDTPDCSQDKMNPYTPDSTTEIDPSESPNMVSEYIPHRSQSFRHRPRTVGPPEAVTRGRSALDESGAERRRSTPTVSRRCSLNQKTRLEPPRTDVWPEPKQPSEVEERFLRLPDSNDYQRVRQFRIDEKGAVVSRGDSFRRKRQLNANGTLIKNELRTSPLLMNGRKITECADSVGGQTTSDTSRSTSISSTESALTAKHSNGRLPPVIIQNSVELEEVLHASTSHPNHYKIFVLGLTGVGKSSLINQFITSEYRNAFSDEIVDDDITNAKSVSVSIGGHECDLAFFEADPQTDTNWKQVEGVHAYLLVYSIDRKSTFRTALRTMEQELRNCTAPIILVGNKVDLERKRTVSAQEVKNVCLTHSIANFEISVALNHDIDDLLVGIIAQIRDAFQMKNNDGENDSPMEKDGGLKESHDDTDDFRAAIRRFSQRKKRQMGIASDMEVETKCTNYFNPSFFYERFRQWRKNQSHIGNTPKC